MEILVLDENGSPFYAQIESKHAMHDQLLGWDLNALQPLIDETQASPQELPTSSGDLIGQNGAMYVMTAAALTHNEYDVIDLKDLSRLTLLMATPLDKQFLRQRSAGLQIDNLFWSVEKPETAAALPIRNRSGVIQGYLSWDLAKPGAAIISTVAIWSTPIAILSLLFGRLLLRRFQALTECSKRMEISSAVIKQSQSYFQSMSDHAARVPVTFQRRDALLAIYRGNAAH
jgi:hypothetical protein